MYQYTFEEYPFKIIKERGREKERRIKMRKNY